MWLAIRAGMAVLLSAAPAFAQTSPPAPVTPASTPDAPAPTKPADAPQTITVTATAPTYKSSIDRRSYSLANDLAASVGSIADALRNVPSVSVDPLGNVSLRGDPSVTILVDGKPSNLFEGPNRGDALQQLPASQFDRVEVMTNPSAAFRPDGTGGIINLITKKVPTGGNVKETGSARINLGTGGRYNASVSGTRSGQGLTLTGSASYRLDPTHKADISTLQEVDPSTGQVDTIRDPVVSENRIATSNARVAADYDLGPRGKLSGDLSWTNAKWHTVSFETYRSSALAGPLAQDYDSQGVDDFNTTDTAGSLSYLLKLPGEDHQVLLRLSLDSTNKDTWAPLTYSYLRPIQPNLFQNAAVGSRLDDTDLTAEYKTPLPGQAKLVTGYEFRLDRYTADHRSLLGTDAADAAPSPLLSNLFRFEQQVHDAYATYERTFGALTILPGIRAEAVTVDTDQATTSAKDSFDYFRLYPTLHLAWKLDDRQQLLASYGRRVQRPTPDFYNPFRIYINPLSFSQGNSRLLPQVTQSYEAGYEFRQKSNYVLATFYYRDNTGTITDIVQDLGGGALLYTKANLGHSRNAGLELAASGHLLPTLTYNVGGNLYWTEIDPTNLGLPDIRSATVLSGRFSLSWKPTSKDFAQLTVVENPKTIGAQVTSSAFTYVNLGYQHRFDDKLAGVVLLRDALEGVNQRVVTDSLFVHDISQQDYRRRELFFGLIYTFGVGATRAPDSFDFR